jgi:phosphoglycolate phosphatase
MKCASLPEGLVHRVVLWDIDGTLIDVVGAKRDKHAEAVMDVVGLWPTSPIRTSGMTDLQIIDVLARSVGIELSEATRLDIMKRLAELTYEHLAEAHVGELSGVRQAIHMVSRRGWTNGLLTGNTCLRAQLKLSRIDLWTAFACGFFGDEALDRFHLVSHCAQQLREVGAYGVVIGDTPLDIEAAHCAGLPVLAVATGHYNLSELAGSGPDLAVSDLDSGFHEVAEFFRVQETLALARPSNT